MPDRAVHDVVVFSTPLCGPCEELKAYLRASGVPFRVRDVLIDEAAGEELETHGIWSTPALCIDGRYSEGFEKAQIDALLQR